VQQVARQVVHVWTSRCYAPEDSNIQITRSIII
jgi:hypothetical protein